MRITFITAGVVAYALLSSFGAPREPARIAASVATSPTKPAVAKPSFAAGGHSSVLADDSGARHPAS